MANALPLGFGLARKRFFHSCLNTDSYDRQQFEKILEMSPKLQALEAQGDEVYPGYVNLMGDQWAALYKTAPEINPEAGGKAAAHRPLMQKMMASEEYEKLRNQTVLDDFSAAIGTLSMSEEIIKFIEKKKEQDKQLKEMMQQQKELQKQMQQNQQAMASRDIQGKKPTKQQEQKAQKLAEQLQQLQQQISQQLADGLNLENLLSQAAQDAQQAKNQVEDLVAGSQPGSGAAEMQKLPLRQQLELAQMLKNNRQVKKVAEWAGRFKTIARKKQKSKHVFSVERDGVIQGDNPELLLPTELAMLNNPATKLDFYRRFTEKQTLQYSPEGKDAAGKGPIVLCLDQSGSMDGRKEQAAGFALAIAMIAKRQGRDFAYIPFSSNVGEVLLFPRGKIPVDGILRIATEFIDGGTNFQQPLEKAIDTIQRRKRFKNADIIFVTDGEARLDGEFLRQYHSTKKKLGFQCMGCLLGDESGGRVLEQFTDEWISARNLIEAAEKSAIFQI